MEFVKPQFLYRGVILNERILKGSPICGIDLTPPRPPQYDEQGRKTVGDGNEYGVYMSDNRSVAVTYASPKIEDGTPLNKNVCITDRNLRTTIPSVGIVYKISTDGLDARRPWITSSLRGVYNNGYGGDEWIADRIPVRNYVIDQAIVGEDILHPEKRLEFNSDEEALLKINQELEERKKRLESFETFIESLPYSDVRNMTGDTLNIYKEIYEENGLIETDLKTFNISNFNDCIKMLKAYYYQTSSSFPSEELKYLANLQSNKDLSFNNFEEKIKSDLEYYYGKKRNYIENQELLGKEYNTHSYDQKIRFISELYINYHEIMLAQATKLTGVMFNRDSDSIVDVRRTEGSFNQRIEDLYYNGELSTQLYQGIKKEIRNEANNIVSMYETDVDDKERNHKQK